jgi:hypothetical protein
VVVFGDENAYFSRKLSEKGVEVESTKSIKIRMPEQSNDYRVVAFGSGGVGKSSLGRFNSVIFPTRKTREKKTGKLFLPLCVLLSAHAYTRARFEAEKCCFLSVFRFHFLLLSLLLFDFWHQNVPRTRKIIWQPKKIAAT